jgi:hypothetical protein
MVGKMRGHTLIIYAWGSRRVTGNRRPSVLAVAAIGTSELGRNVSHSIRRIGVMGRSNAAHAKPELLLGIQDQTQKPSVWTDKIYYFKL